MLPFALPFAFVAFVAVPVLAGIYWLRNRFRRHTVSSLILWANQRQAREGGSRLRRIQTPLLFFLELLAIALIVIAAARPMVQSERAARPLIVVLDDSFSMLAGGAGSPRNSAIGAIKKELRRRLHYSVRFVLAGQAPQVLGEPVKRPSEADALLREWRCRSPSDCLDQAVTFAAELGGRRARILVVTDRAPSAELGENKVKWWAFGTPRPNVAFVSAARTSLNMKERCLLEIANLSSQPARTTLTLAGAASAGPSGEARLDLKPGETRRMLFEFDEQPSALRARIGDDVLRIDNSIVLLPQTRRPVRAQVRIGDAGLRAIIEKGLAATGQTEIVTTRPELILTDGEGFRAAHARTWVVQVLVEKDAEAYAGPFVIDRTHPLTEGLSLEGVVWGAGKAGDLDGLPVISAGSTPLLTDTEGVAGSHYLRMRLRADLSILAETPSWPILMWNLVEWRRSEAPGVQHANVRLGTEAVVTAESDAESARITTPDGGTHDVLLHGKRVAVRAEAVGVYQVRVNDGTYHFASNALSRGESDLARCASVRLGKWVGGAALRREYRSVAWVFLLAALGSLAAHAAIAARRA